MMRQCRLLFFPFALGGTLFVGQASAQTTDAKPQAKVMDHATAENMVATVMKTLQTGLPPKSQEDFDAHAKRLHALLAESGPTVDQNALHAEIRGLLSTIDNDGHSGLMDQVQHAAFVAQTNPSDAQRESTAYLTEGTGGQILVVAPPQATYHDMAEITNGANELVLAIDSHMQRSHACGLVVDLTDQKGGDAWPALIALGPLFTQENTARNVDRNNVRTPVATPSQLFSGAKNPLYRFHGQPFAVVFGEQTASAGEMLAIALAGERQAHSFGFPTYGLTTANSVMSLQDGSILIWSRYRYALGNDAPIRGKFQPMTPAANDTPRADIVRQAADWVSTASPLCQKEKQ